MKNNDYKSLQDQEPSTLQVTHKTNYKKKQKHKKEQLKYKQQQQKTKQHYKKITLGDSKGHWGDKLVKNSNWPILEDTSYIRIVHQNVNGISYHNNYNEWEIALEVMDQYQADIIGLNEINLDTNQPKV